MTKDSVIQMREAFSTSPLKITCDNMIVLYDQTGLYPNLIWNDGDETLMAFRANTESNQDSRPFEIFCTTYENIQYIEALTNPSVAVEWVNANITDEDQKKLAMELIKNTIAHRSYTGTTAMKNVYNKSDKL